MHNVETVVDGMDRAGEGNGKRYYVSGPRKLTFALEP
jgi:hypothetical protein